jgi:hypothetical protein
VLQSVGRCSPLQNGQKSFLFVNSLLDEAAPENITFSFLGGWRDEG